MSFPIQINSSSFTFRHEAVNNYPLQVSIGKTGLLGWKITNNNPNPVFVKLYDNIYTNIWNTPIDPHFVITIAANTTIVKESTGQILKQFDNSVCVLASANENNLVAIPDQPVDIELIIDKSAIVYQGVLISDDFSGAALSSNWVATTAGATFTQVSYLLRLSGNASTNFLDYLSYNLLLPYEEYDITWDFYSNSGNGNGAGVGVVSSAGSFICGLMNISLITSGSVNSSGNNNIYRNPATTILKAQTGLLPIAGIGALYKYRGRLRRRKNNIYFDLINNLGQVSSNSAVDTLNGNFNQAHKLALFQLSGTTDFTKIQFRSLLITSPEILFIGDSNTYAITTVDYRYAMYLQQNTKSKLYQVVGVPGVKMTDYATYDASLLPVKAKNVTIMMGSNDVIASVSTASFLASMQTRITSHVANGSAVYLFEVPPQAGANAGNNAAIDAYNAGLSTLTGVSGIILINTVLKNGTSALHSSYDQGDGLHMTREAHRLVATQAKAQFSALFS